MEEAQNLVSKELADQYKAACAMYEEAKAMKERIRESLVETASYVGDYMCNGVRVTKEQRRGLIDYKSIPEVMDYIADGTIEFFRKESSEVFKVDIYG